MSRGSEEGLKARGRGVGRWRHRYAKYADWLSKQECKAGVFEFSHPETRFSKSAFTGTAFKGSICMIGQNDVKHVRSHTKAYPCGWPLNLLPAKDRRHSFSLFQRLMSQGCFVVFCTLDDDINCEALGIRCDVSIHSQHLLSYLPFQARSFCQPKVPEVQYNKFPPALKYQRINHVF